MRISKNTRQHLPDYTIYKGFHLPNQLPNTRAIFIGWENQITEPFNGEHTFQRGNCARKSHYFQHFLCRLNVSVHVLVVYQVAECLPKGNLGDYVQCEVLCLTS